MLQGYGTKEDTPFLYLFDSFPGNRAEAIQNIRDYLSQEWFEKKVKLEAFRRKNFSADEMALIEPVKPEQNNEYDCGIYLLTYIEKIFNDIEIFIGEKTVAQKNLATWFSMEKISCQRKIIKSTIFELAEEQNPSNLYITRTVLVSWLAMISTKNGCKIWRVPSSITGGGMMKKVKTNLM